MQHKRCFLTITIHVSDLNIPLEKLYLTYQAPHILPFHKIVIWMVKLVLNNAENRYRKQITDSIFWGYFSGRNYFFGEETLLYVKLL